MKSFDFPYITNPLCFIVQVPAVIVIKLIFSLLLTLWRSKLECLSMNKTFSPKLLLLDINELK
jgi:hypothetical protein